MSMQLKVVEISPAMPAGDAAALIQQHRVLVLINLNGWTLHDRNDVFALQPSPVQVLRLLPPPCTFKATSHKTVRSDGSAIPQPPAADS
jgi:predicted O-linked N-acetylglucosamine transferase (SPINDLY family)